MCGGGGGGWEGVGGGGGCVGVGVGVCVWGGVGGGGGGGVRDDMDKWETALPIKFLWKIQVLFHLSCAEIWKGRQIDGNRKM